MDSGTQMPVSAWSIPLPALICVFLKKFSQNMAMDQLGIMYGNTKTVEMNFLQGRSLLVMNQATTPPKSTATKQAIRAMIVDCPSGVQNLVRAYMYSLLVSSSTQWWKVNAPFLTPPPMYLASWFPLTLNEPMSRVLSGRTTVRIRMNRKAIVMTFAGLEK